MVSSLRHTVFKNFGKIDYLHYFRRMIKDYESRKWDFADGVLPQIHISGCPSSCGTHQIGKIGFRGGMKKVDGKPVSAFVMTVNGEDEENNERFGEQLGTILETDIPAFFKDLGEEISASGMLYDDWYAKNPERFKEIAGKYL